MNGIADDDHSLQVVCELKPDLAMIFKALAAKALTITVDRYLWPEKHLRNVCEVIICFVSLRN